MADKNGIKLVNYYLLKLKSFFFSKDILSFLLFLGLSSTFWFVNALGKERDTIITIPIRYIGVPQNIDITNVPPTEIKLNVKDQGVKLFDYRQETFTPLTIDLYRSFDQKGEILITSDQINDRIKRYMHLQPSTIVLEVQPDSILVQYQKLSMKTLPVEFIANLELAHQYILSDKIKIEPSTVTVFGPKKVLDSLKTIKTEFVKFKNLNDTNIIQCKLKPIKSVRYSTNEIKISVFVELFTEKKVIVPITSINCPENLSIRTFPAFVSATYSVGLSKFNSVNQNAIRAYLDYNDLVDSKESKRKLKIKNNLSNITNLRISPQEVEFILEEK